MKMFKQTDERIMYSYIVRIDKNIHIIDKNLINMVLAPCRQGRQGENDGSGWLYFGSKNLDWHKYESIF